MDKVRATAVLNEIKRITLNVGKIDKDSAKAVSNSRFYMANFPLIVNRGENGTEERVPFRLYPKMSKSAGDVICDLVNSLRLVGQEEMIDYEPSSPFDDFAVGVYISAEYIDNAIKLGDEPARDVLYDNTIYKLGTTGIINGTRLYAQDVFISLLNNSEVLRYAFDRCTKIYNEGTRDETLWDKTRNGVQNNDTDAGSLMSVVLGVMYAYYIANEEYLNGYIDTKLNYIQKFNSYMSTMNFFMNKINKVENLQFTRDLLEIKDSVFFSVLNNFMQKNGVMSETKVDLRYGANILSLMGVYNKGLYVQDHNVDKRVRGENLITEGKACIAESAMIDFKTKPFLLANALTFEPTRTLNFFSEFLNITVNRTQAETLTEFSRKIDQVALLYESMTNQWHKSDAIDAAYAVLKDIDDAYADTTDKDFMIALDDLRKQLMDIIMKGRNMDVQKRRMTVSINYPAGYKA